MQDRMHYAVDNLLPFITQHCLTITNTFSHSSHLLSYSSRQNIINSRKHNVRQYIFNMSNFLPLYKNETIYSRASVQVVMSLCLLPVHVMRRETIFYSFYGHWSKCFYTISQHHLRNNDNLKKYIFLVLFLLWQTNAELMFYHNATYGFSNPRGIGA